MTFLSAALLETFLTKITPSAAAKIRMPLAAQISMTIVNPNPTTSAAIWITKSIAMDSAGPRISLAVIPLLENTTVNTKTTSVSHTAAVMMTTSAVKREKLANPREISAVKKMKRNAVENVFLRKTTVALKDNHGAITLNNAQNTAAKSDGTGANGHTNANKTVTVANTTIPTVNTLENVLAMMNSAAPLILPTANIPTLALLTVANMTKPNTKSGVVSTKNAEMNVTAAMMDMKLANVKVVPMILIQPVMTATEKSAAKTTGVKTPKSVLQTKKLAVLPMDTHMLDLTTSTTMTSTAAHMEITTTLRELRKNTM